MSEGRDPKETPYEMLGVDANATDAEITTAYRHLARERHPDTNPAGSADAFSELTDAYDVLRDPARRRAYDDTRQARGRAAAAAAGVRIPVRHVAQPAPRPPRPSDAPPRREAATRRTDLDLSLSFDQAALGTTVVIAADVDEPCQACAGTGHTPSSATACDGCGGTGATTRVSGGITIRTACSRCAGAGHAPPSPCPVCTGTGTRRRPHDITVRVPAGVDTGTRLRIRAPGAGELTGVIRVKDHPYFTRTGNDLHVRVPVTIAEATLGAVITVPTLDDAVAIRLPPGTPSGRTMRIRGRGITARDRAGDLLATIDVVIPATLNDQQRAALESFAAATESPRRHLETWPAAADGDP